MNNKPGYKYVRLLNEIGPDDSHLVGGKAANLARLINDGINCPPGFCIISKAFDLFLTSQALQVQFNSILNDATKSSVECANQIQSILSGSLMPEPIRDDVVAAYNEMGKMGGSNIPVAVRSSALVEDSAGNSFAGQFDSYLGIHGENNIIDAVIRCWASLYNARSIAYSRRRKVSTEALSMAVIVQKLIRAEQAGVMFTVHPVTFDPNQIIVEATLGLGEQLVSGRVSPDTFVVSKADFSIINRKIAKKTTHLVFDQQTASLENRLVDTASQHAPAITDDKFSELATIGVKIENNFKVPQDIEWAIEKDNIYIVQSRPMTVLKKAGSN